MAAKTKAPASGNFFAVVGSDDGMVREKALELYNELTGGVDDGFTHETIDGIADNSDSAFDICSSTIQALQTIPMFGGDKVVWLRNANFLGDNVTGRGEKMGWYQGPTLIEYLETVDVDPLPTARPKSPA